MSTLGENLVCEASGIPTPDITVTLPSGLNKTVQSGGRVTVGANSTVTVNVTADVTGLYVCTATSPVGSTFATLSVEVRLDKPTHPTLEPDLHDSTNCTLELKLDRPTTVLSEPDKSTTFTLEPALAVFPALTITGRSGKPESGSGEDSGLSVSLTVLVGVICAINVAVLIGVIIVVIKWHKRRNNNAPSHPDPQNSTSVTASQDQTALAMSPAAIRSLIGNPMYDTGTAVVQHTHEDVDHISPTGSTDPNSNGCTATNDTANVTASQDQATLSESKVVIKSMINPQYNSRTAVSEHTYEDVDNLSPTGSTDPNSNGCTATNNTANVTASQDQATLRESRVVIKPMINPQYNSGTAVLEHTYEDVDNLSPTGSTDPNSNGCTATNNTINVTASQDQATMRESQVVIKSMINPQYNTGTAISEHTYEDVDVTASQGQQAALGEVITSINPQDDSETTAVEHTYGNEDMLPTSPTDPETRNNTVTVTARQDETESGCYQSETISQSSNPQYDSRTIVSNLCHHLYN
ncbi:hypothetical protein Bbelb_153340 [Branchiostoma belcheri]|nr:hypothetical protein Bbelb_153340 [Branchiostoma belcheri]